jgi:hypothetical protein
VWEFVRSWDLGLGNILYRPSISSREHIIHRASVLKLVCMVTKWYWYSRHELAFSVVMEHLVVGTSALPCDQTRFDV